MFLIKPIDVSGERYEAVVPDTLDLAERAELAINALTGICDPEFDYFPYMYTRLNTKPPYMWHADYDTTCEPKVARALPMMRVMSGSKFNSEIDGKLMDAIISHVGEDGLYYSKWFHLKHPKTERYGPHNYPLSDEEFAIFNGNFQLLMTMMVWYQVDHDPAWKKRIQKLIDGWNKIAFYKDDYAYVPDSMIGEQFSYPKSGWRTGLTKEPHMERYGAEGSVFDTFRTPIHALALWYEMSGDKKALELAQKFVNFVLKPRFWVDAEQAKFPADAHHHAHISLLWALLEYARVAKDQRLMNFVRNGYEYSRTLGIPRFGCFKSATEACASSDMVALAIRLCDAGVGDYWNDVDQYVRNQFTEHQLTRVDLAKKVSGTAEEHTVKPPYESSDQVIEKNLGYFSMTNSPTTLMASFLITCCLGNGTMGLYYAWESIVRCKDDMGQVNLLLNRASPRLDIDSYLPYEGKVVIKNKTAKKLSVRIPNWIDKKAIKSTVNGKEANPFWVGNYLVFEKLRTKDVVIMEFPIVETTEEYTLGGKEYTCHFKGNTLIDISPRAESPKDIPMYLRDQMKQNKAPMKKVTRYVSPITIQW